MGKRLVNILDKALDTALVIVCILLLLIGLYSVLDDLWLYENATDNSVLVYRPELDQVLGPEKRISKNHVAWITVHDTGVDFPVMQGIDNAEYLNRNPFGEFALSGSIFLDFRNDPELTDEYSLIYGHHMSGGAMFGCLDSFESKGYFDAHREGTATTAGHVYDFRTFAVISADGTLDLLFNPVAFSREEILDYLRENAAVYYEPPEGERILALSTCAGATDISRLLVIGTIRERTPAAPGAG